MRISLLRFFKTITKIWLMRFYGLFTLLLGLLAKIWLLLLFPGSKSHIRREPSVPIPEMISGKNV